VPADHLAASDTRDFSTPFLPPGIPNDLALRRGLVPFSGVTCRRERRDSMRLDRRGQLLLRVADVGRLRDLQPRVRAAVGPRRPRRPGDHSRVDLRGHGHSTDGEPGAAKQGRGLSRLSRSRVEVHPAAAAAAFEPGPRPITPRGDFYTVSTPTLSCSSSKPISGRADISHR
jgi:hypothetical protein